MLQRFQQGRPAAAIAEELEIPARTVRRLLRRIAEDANRLTPGYDRCGRPKQQPSEIIEEALGLREQHPGWGAGLIRVLLKREQWPSEVPCERTFQRWFRRLGTPPAPPGRRPEAQSNRAQHPHEVWQVDAADQMRLKQGQASWLRATDECSGAVLKTIVFSRRKLGSGAAGQDPTGDAEAVWPVGPARTRAR
jgi:transposase